MNDSSFLRVLAVPNLQGERFSCEMENSQIDWVKDTNSLPHQVAALRQEYNGQQLLIGSSFGGLAAWMFAAEHCPITLKGLVLVDVLPNRTSFPKRRRVGFSILHHLPTRLSQSIYNQHRRLQGQPSVQVSDILQRIRSIQQDFPKPHFPVPTLVVSTNTYFHDKWQELSQSHVMLTAQNGWITTRGTVGW